MLPLMAPPYRLHGRAVWFAVSSAACAAFSGGLAGGGPDSVRVSMVCCPPEAAGPTVTLCTVTSSGEPTDGSRGRKESNAVGSMLVTAPRRIRLYTSIVVVGAGSTGGSSATTNPATGAT